MQSFIPSAMAVAVAATPQPNPAQARGRAAASTGDSKPFAQQLEKQREARAAKPAESKRAEAANDEPHHNAARLPAARKAGAAPHVDAVDAKPAAESTQPAEADSDAEAGTAFITDWLARLNPAPETPPQADASVVPAAPAVAAAVALTPPTAPLLATSSTVTEAQTPGVAVSSRGVETPTPLPAATQQPRTPASADPRDADLAANEWQRAPSVVLSDAAPQRAAEAIGQRQIETSVHSDAPLPAPNLAGAGSPVSLSVRAAEAAPLHLATPVTSPEFRAALGMQISVLAHSGVQQAELHLNPAHMGPVSIQIVLDGQQAQINFGADSALTRQIIESGMPELASALREAGLTLTGGGVSQHAGGQRQDSGAQGAMGDARGDADSRTPVDPRADAQLDQARRSAVRSALGGVDLYA